VIAGIIAGYALGNYAGGIPNRTVTDDVGARVNLYDFANGEAYNNGWDSSTSERNWPYYGGKTLPSLLKTAGILIGLYVGGIIAAVVFGGVSVASWYPKRRKIKKWVRVAKKFFSHYGNKEVMEHLENVEKSLNNKKTAMISLASFFGGLALSIIPGYAPATELFKGLTEVLKLDGIHTYKDFVEYATKTRQDPKTPSTTSS